MCAHFFSLSLGSALCGHLPCMRPGWWCGPFPTLGSPSWWGSRAPSVDVSWVPGAELGVTQARLIQAHRGWVLGTLFTDDRAEVREVESLPEVTQQVLARELNHAL